MIADWPGLLTFVRSEMNLYQHFIESLLSVLEVGKFCLSIAKPLANAFLVLKNACEFRRTFVKVFLVLSLRAQLL